MRIQAWMCDKCSRLYPGESKPHDWIEVSTATVGKSRSREEALFCSTRCAGLWFRGRNEERTVSEEVVVHKSPAAAGVCPACSWTSAPRKKGEPVKNKAQSLRMHIRRVHPGEGLEAVS